ncbi:MAG TPA: sulfate adenylyltransferase [Gammaproteobacteria bacterium]|jgi:sulfate adenylyltransferase|nr:sulfate adenylyltransferase [Acidiferrobacteraceae bacterium]MDP6397680.1 sulfate adenylyltransferase [Arenicellales bacterium]HCX88539.1 sulfate adenylyltransferase [Gammaproteobacteria bacterium]MDP6551431.1 sulfate adenylyltransferase [Arenicellales bacterium]MDP6790498.1 sulfate adenylyltransferase [Arenicellales bacterium]|tara:strand:+ start:14343 stop:15542 length:1200 start_codon:yes stop_codon:yes gene_type:complete
MIRPHGCDFLMPLLVDNPARLKVLQEEAAYLPSMMLSSAAAANAVMLGAGYFTPLAGFMDKADALRVARDMRTSKGLFWPVPVLNLTTEGQDIAPGSRLALRDPNVAGNPVIAIQDVQAVEELSQDDVDFIAQQVYRTTDQAHPGVSTFASLGRVVVSGPIEVLNLSYFQSDFPDTFRSAVDIRAEIEKRGWNNVVAFQTRNPMHRAHEELCKMALEAVDADGVLIHMLLGKLKPGDIPADVRDAAIRKMVELYFPPNSVMITGYGFDMLYAGPREAVLHALFRQNAGCTHLIVGRDHAGVGDYYGAFDAQTIFDESVPADALEIKIFRADHTAYSTKLNKVVMMRDAPDHQKEDFVLLSGTRVREMLGAGEDLPVEFARPEVARILMDHFAQEAANTA